MLPIGNGTGPATGMTKHNALGGPAYEDALNGIARGRGKWKKKLATTAATPTAERQRPCVVTTVSAEEMERLWGD